MNLSKRLDTKTKFQKTVEEFIKALKNQIQKVLNLLIKLSKSFLGKNRLYQLLMLLFQV